jgi:SAM-dependent methyltransferase
VGSTGRALGLDLDAAKLDMARQEAAEQHLANVEFRQSAIETCGLRADFDLVYARFLLTHLADSLAMLRQMQAVLRPGGIVAIEDIDFQGSFCHPPCSAYSRYVELYTRTVQRNGGDANIGPRLPGMLRAIGCKDVQMNVVQPAGLEGEVKLLAPVTMENIADAVLVAGLATKAEVDQIIAELYECAHDWTTVMALPRVVQAWGSTPAGITNVAKSLQ